MGTKKPPPPHTPIHLVLQFYVYDAHWLASEFLRNSAFKGVAVSHPVGVQTRHEMLSTSSPSDSPEIQKPSSR